MSKITLGEIQSLDDVSLSELRSKRDAVHVSVALVIAAQKLNPGQRVGFVGDGYKVGPVPASRQIGVVDPFLNGPAFESDLFWLILLPGMTADLRHTWTNPAFAKVDATESDTPAEETDDYGDECRGCNN